MNLPLICLLFGGLAAVTSAKAASLNSGPVLTHLSAREAQIWLQWSDLPESAYIEYSNPAEPERTFRKAIKVDDFGISHTTLERIDPGRTYVYSIVADGSSLAREFFTAPFHYKDIRQPPAFSVAIIGNHYVLEDSTEPPYQVLGGNYEIFSKVQESKISGIIWAGSSSFLRDMDAGSWSGIMRRHGYNRAHPATQSLFGTVWNKAVPGLGNFSALHSSPTHAPLAWARAAFAHFWPSSAAYHLKSEETAPLYYSFRWADIEFFFLDTLSERIRYHERMLQPELMNEPQLDWLVGRLAASDASFKVIVSGTALLAPADNPSNFSFADQQQERFYRRLQRNRIDGLVFITGGKHFGELTKFVRPEGYSMFELSVGSTTYQDPNNPKESNFFREPLTYSEAPQFGLLSVGGDEGDRILTLSLVEASGTVVFERQISQRALAWDE